VDERSDEMGVREENDHDCIGRALFPSLRSPFIFTLEKVEVMRCVEEGFLHQTRE
jgi:hypothetical protein